MVERGWPQTTTWLIRIACWISKATPTLTMYMTYCFSTATNAARTQLNIKLYAHCPPVNFSYVIYILMRIFPDNGSWRKQSVGRNRNCFSTYAVCVDVGLSKKKKIS